MSFTSWKTISALKQFRVAKFKQRRQIMTRPLLQQMKNIQVGGCTGLSFSWVQRHQRQRGETPANRIDYLNTDIAWKNTDYFAGYFNNTKHHSYADRIASVAPTSLGMRHGGVVIEKNYDTYGSALQHLSNNPGHHIVMMVLSGKGISTNHVCALYVDADGMKFFDPNSGEYRCTTGKRLDFFKQLTAQYHTYVSSGGVAIDITFKEVQFHHVG
ncbi:YopT-type cysteine protease domain-containing protein [Hahella chejuensis]|nr:YopT-type cysteine protease domain-containing protein [Hahella chejuensis]